MSATEFIKEIKNFGKRGAHIHISKKFVGKKALIKIIDKEMSYDSKNLNPKPQLPEIPKTNDNLSYDNIKNNTNCHMTIDVPDEAERDFLEKMKNTTFPQKLIQYAVKQFGKERTHYLLSLIKKSA